MDYHQLENMEFFGGVRQETLAALWKAGSLRQCKKGTVLFHARQTIFFQLSGKSIIYTNSRNGRRKIHFVFGPGVLLNQNTTAGLRESSCCETIEDSLILTIPVADFEQQLQKDYSLVRSVLTEQERRLWRLEHQLENSVNSVFMERKLAAKLWKLARDFGTDTPAGREIDFNISITFLADMLGTPRETASRLCNQLCGCGLIEISKKRITVTDTDRLAAFYKTEEG